jgi:hypothetical protein
VEQKVDITDPGFSDLVGNLYFDTVAAADSDMFVLDVVTGIADP